MDYYAAHEEPDCELDLVELSWNLLSQWKAVLIVALVMALVIPGARLLKDKGGYEAAAREREAAVAAKTGKSVEELVEDALAGLSEEGRATVQRLAKQQELALSQEAYLNESMLLSGDLANQRQLQMRFYLTVADGVTLQPLADAYKSLFTHDSVMKHIGTALDPTADIKYIRELVNFYAGAIPDSSSTGVIITVSVVLTPDAEVPAIKAAVTKELEGVKNSLAESVGDHDIKLIDAEQTQTYNTTSMDRRVALTNGINGLLSSYKTAVASLTKEQKAALDTINKIQSSETVDAEEGEVAQAAAAAEPEAPAFSLKFALGGFVGGILAYAIIYVMAVALSRRLTSAEGLEAYTACRLLGDVCYPRTHKGLAKLFHSRLVDRRRYGRRGDVASQVGKVVSAMGSVCEHARTSIVTVLCMGCPQDEAARIVDEIASGVNAAGIQANVVDASGELDEKALLDVRDAVFVMGDTAKGPDVWHLTELCCGYDVQRLGCVYVIGY